MAGVGRSVARFAGAEGRAVRVARERFEGLPGVVAEREAFRRRVRRAQLEGRVARGTVGGFYSEADIEHARAALDAGVAG